MGEPMTRMSRPAVVLATLLAVLMPLEQAHCAWMGMERNAAKVGGARAAQNHDCCAAGHSHSPKPPTAPVACACARIPLGTLPLELVGTHVVSVACSIVLPSTPSIVPVASIEESARTLDIGSPPLLIDLGARGLRAPPVSA